MACFPISCRAHCAVILAVLSILVMLPRPGDVNLPQIPGSMPVMSFNIRYDGPEADDRNHFRHRVHRLSRFLNETEPWLVGLQEALASQVLHLQGLLPQYEVVGFEGDGHGQMDKADLRRQVDFQTGIFYDRRRLVLAERDHIWLSETPRTINSRSWGSRGARTLTIAAFRSSGKDYVDVVLLNTHLDVWSASAREGQARLVSDTAHEWIARYPTAAVFITGDFNSVPGQEPHRLLLRGFRDSWDVCERDSACRSEPFAATFHGWYGSIVNRYAMRVIQFVLLALHGSGVEFPTHVPNSLREGLRMAKAIIKHEPRLSSFMRALPASTGRLHVDWVLFSRARVRGVGVGDVRDRNFSSDHFPLVAFFELH
eukprot:TRINITY_DN73887_c0_g1_i1.p1 TRINITY_DN73887_c0_g1~~TRINITY_DN73887_c0_g1_i1.p1  ORF type:complete len:370 (+),score=13.21 TRINITY_DN73887_c0_g1_i1:137-1246(+)